MNKPTKELFNKIKHRIMDGTPLSISDIREVYDLRFDAAEVIFDELLKQEHFELIECNSLILEIKVSHEHEGWDERAAFRPTTLYFLETVYFSEAREVFENMGIGWSDVFLWAFADLRDNGFIVYPSADLIRATEAESGLSYTPQDHVLLGAGRSEHLSDITAAPQSRATLSIPVWVTPKAILMATIDEEELKSLLELHSLANLGQAYDVDTDR